VTARLSADDAAIAAAAFEALQVGIFAVDRAGRLVAWNTSMEHQTGVPPEEAIGRRVGEVLCSTPRTWFARETRAVFEHGRVTTSKSQEQPHLTPVAQREGAAGEGAMRQDVTFFPVRGPDGAVRACGVAVVDATETALAHLALQAANASLEKALDALELLTRTDGPVSRARQRSTPRDPG
jgi:PAS domain S-box-containing protein